MSPAKKVHEAYPSVVYTDAELVIRAVHSAGYGRERVLRWIAVRDAFSVGSGIAQELCRACGLAPDELVGTDDGGKE